MDMNTYSWLVQWFLLYSLWIKVSSLQELSPCGNTDFKIFIPEYPGISGNIDIPSSELDKYSSLLLTTNVNGIKVDIEGDENLPLPDGLSDVNISNILRISWKEAHPPGLYVTLLKGFDRDGLTKAEKDDVNSLHFVVICSYSDNPFVVFRHKLTLVIADVNDNAPQFLAHPFSDLKLSEATDVGSTVFTFTVYDIDQGRNAEIVYNIDFHATSKVTEHGLFVFPCKNTPQLVLSKPLDYEALPRIIPTYTLKITATDEGSNATSLSNWTILDITVTDADDQGPVFRFVNSSVNYIFADKLSTVRHADGRVTGLTHVQLRPSNGLQPIQVHVHDGDSLSSPILCIIAFTLPSTVREHLDVSTLEQFPGIFVCLIRIHVHSISNDMTSISFLLVATEDTVKQHSSAALIELPLNRKPGNNTIISINSSQGYNYHTQGALVALNNSLCGIIKVLVLDKRAEKVQIIDSTIDSKASNDKTIIVYVAQSGFVDVNYHDLLVATLPAGSYRADDNHTIVRLTDSSVVSRMNSTDLHFSIVELKQHVIEPKFRISGNGDIHVSGKTHAGSVFRLRANVMERKNFSNKVLVDVVICVAKNDSSLATNVNRLTLLFGWILAFIFLSVSIAFLVIHLKKSKVDNNSSKLCAQQVVNNSACSPGNSSFLTNESLPVSCLPPGQCINILPTRLFPPPILPRPEGQTSFTQTPEDPAYYITLLPDSAQFFDIPGTTSNPKTVDKWTNTTEELKHLSEGVNCRYEQFLNESWMSVCSDTNSETGYETFASQHVTESQSHFSESQDDQLCTSRSQLE